MLKSKFFRFVIFSVGVFFLVGLWSIVAAADTPGEIPSKTHFENDRIAVTVDVKTGGIRTIVDKQLNKTYKIDDPGFLVEVGEGKKEGSLSRITPADCDWAGYMSGNQYVVISFKAKKVPVDVTVFYGVDWGDPFVEKIVKVNYHGKGDYNVSRVEMFDWKMAEKPSKAIPYYGFLYSDRSCVFKDKGISAPSDNSIAYFFRYGDGGLFTSVSCDFVLMHQDKTSGEYRSTYWPGQILPAEKRFHSEKGFFGVYQRKGQFHAPYKPNKDLKDFLTPNVDAGLDRAEIEAVQATVQKYLKPEVFIFLANGWALDLPYQLNSPEAVKKFKAAIDNIKRFPQMEALHFIDNFCGLSDEFTKNGLKMPVKPNRYAEEVFEYAKQKGIGLSMFIWTNRRQKDQATISDGELLTIDEKGKRRPDAIALSKSYGDFIFDTVSTLITKYPHIKGLTYDFMYIRPDHDPNHGYLPGHGSLYSQWANIRDTNRRIRKAFPDLMLRYQIGWRSLGPWLAEHASFVHNAHDPNIENQRNFLDFHVGYQFANNYRLGSWFANNNKMFPRYMMNAFVVHKTHSFDAWDYDAWEYCIMSRIACSCGFGMLSAFPDEAQGEVFSKEQRAFLDKWISWQREHKDYYVNESELFGEPSPRNVDGYAYGNGQDSIVFVCNPTFETKTVAIPIDRTIHLPPGKRWTVKELYPEARYRVGPFNDGLRFVTAIPPQTVCLFEVKPYQADRALLMGVEGRLTPDPKDKQKLVLSDLRGPIGTKRLVIVRPPDNQTEPVELVYQGKTLPTTRSNHLLLAKIQFDGEEIRPEVHNWRATREGKRIKIRAKIDVPRDAKKLLDQKRKTMPVSKKYDTPKWLDRTAWLGPGRFIIHLPIAPPNLNIDSIRAGSPEKAIKKLKGFNVKARLNGQPIAVHSNIMGLDKRCRWSGFFIDATDAIRYGEANELELDLPPVRDQNFFGIYLPNLTPQYTDQCTVLDPPKSLTIVDMPDATEAYPPLPKLKVNHDSVTFWVALDISGRQPVLLPREAISVRGAISSKVRWPDADSRWAVDRDKKSGVLVDVRKNRILLEVTGKPPTKIQIGTDPKTACTFTLGEMLHGWQERKDRFDPLALELSWPSQKATVRVKLIAPPEKKPMVREDL